MAKIMICGRGGSGKSTLVTLLAKALAERGRVLVVDSDESNLGLHRMLGLSTPATTLMNWQGGKTEVGKKMFVSLMPIMQQLQQGGADPMQQGSADLVPPIEVFTESPGLADLPPECMSGGWPLRLLLIGKIEHPLEGCACPMGAVTRSFLKQLQLEEKEWVLVDTDAGTEHFGRGVFEGIDLVRMVVDPSYEAILLAERAKNLAKEARKDFVAVLNKVDPATESFLRQELSARGVSVRGTLGFSPEIMKANLEGKPLVAESWQEKVKELLTSLSF